MLPGLTPLQSIIDAKAACPGCGAEEIATSAGVCPVCGKRVGEGFQPLDAIRSSYRLQGRELLTFPAQLPKDRFGSKPNGFADTAWACAVYSMVPYLGILFAPLAIGVGTVGYFTGRSDKEVVGAPSALVCVAVSVAVLIVQIFLWWLLYLIPEIGI